MAHHDFIEQTFKVNTNPPRAWGLEISETLAEQILGESLGGLTPEQFEEKWRSVVEDRLVAAREEKLGENAHDQAVTDVQNGIRWVE